MVSKLILFAFLAIAPHAPNALASKKECHEIITRFLWKVEIQLSYRSLNSVILCVSQARDLLSDVLYEQLFSKVRNVQP